MGFSSEKEVLYYIPASAIPGCSCYPWKSFSFGDAAMTLVLAETLLKEIVSDIGCDSRDSVQEMITLRDHLERIPSMELIGFDS